MSYETIIWKESDGVGRLTLNRPETLNAWTAQFGSELRQVIEGEAAQDFVSVDAIADAGKAEHSRKGSAKPFLFRSVSPRKDAA